MKITTLLQVYKRPNYLQEQIDSIKNQSIKSDKIVVVYNEGGINIPYPDDVELIYANPNKKYHLRFAVGLLYDTDYLAIFDDDTIPGINWYKNCLEMIEKYNCICVSNGRLYDINANPIGGPGWATKNGIEVEVDFGGHAWFFKKEHLKYMWYDDIHEYENGEDIMLSANAKIYGGIKTFVPPHPWNETDRWGSGSNAMKYGSDNVASWLTNPVHNEQRQKLIKYYQNKNWKLLCQKI